MSFWDSSALVLFEAAPQVSQFACSDQRLSTAAEAEGLQFL